MDAQSGTVPKAKRKSGEIRLGLLNIPVRLLQALREDRLVIFAGAGVSKPAPSNLPDFEVLTEQIAEGALERKANEPPDIFLGRLAQAEIQVHHKAAKILSRPSSQPSELHRLLVGLFPTASSVRIVTTNFDRHFESAISDRWPDEDIEIYSAPALPLGSRFSGLVYVHGQLGRDARRLVLTDSDFGKAYLTEGWARRLLREVFASYDVLFVGYSHEDVVLRYLARGLPPTRERMRFALTPSGSSERWQFLGITPLEYDLADHHAALREGLKAWLDLEGRGPLSHEREVQELVQRSPQALTEQEEDYLLFCIQDPKLSQFFYRHAAASEWLIWANERSLTSHLFNPNSETPEAIIAACWLMQEALTDRGDVAREIISKASRLSSKLWNEIARAVWRALDDNGEIDAKATERAAQWLSILELHDEASFDINIIDYWLNHLSAEKHAFFAVQVLTYLLRPIGAFEKRLSHSEEDEWKHVLKPSVKVRGDRHCLSEEWERLFKPNLHLFAHHLAPIFLSHLHEAHLLLRSQGTASKAFDPLSYGRSAIEPHEQNQHGINEAFDILIDAGRDVFDWLLKSEPRVARHLIEAWLPIEAPLVRRLCIYGIAQHPQMSANTKIGRLVSEKWLEQWQLKHEAFSLLRGAYKDSGVSIRKRLLREAERAYIKQADKVFDDPVKEEKSRAHELFNFLAWLKEADPSCPLLSERLTILRQGYPELEVQDHPDFSHWSYGVHTIHYVSPVSTEELLRLEPFEWIKAFEEASAQKDDPRHLIERGDLGFLTETEKAAGRDFEWGVKLAEYLAVQELWNHSGWHYLLRCWANQPLNDLEWKRLLAFLQRHKELFRHGIDIADVLSRRIENRDAPATEEMIREGVVLADSLWSVIPSEEEEEDVHDWVQAGVNKAGGKLGLFIVYSLSRLWRIHKEEWRGIPDSFRPLLKRMAHAGPGCSPFGRVMLCSQLHFMFAIDSSWTKANLFPLFDWSLSTWVAVQTWHGFLVWGRPTRELLAEFMPRVEQTFDHLRELGKFSKRFSEILASIAYSSPDNPLEKGWIKAFLRKARPAERIEWVRTIDSILSDISKEERKRLWESWLRSYFEFRLDSGIPFEDDEWRAMIKWSIPLEDLIPEVVELLTRRPAVKSRDSLLYYQIRKQDGLFQYPNSLADFLLYLLGAEEDLFHHCNYLAEIFHRLLKAGASRVKLRQIAERLAELGCTNAQELAGLIEEPSATDDSKLQIKSPEQEPPKQS
jgi:hypothetical protein